MRVLSLLVSSALLLGCGSGGDDGGDDDGGDGASSSGSGESSGTGDGDGDGDGDPVECGDTMCGGDEVCVRPCCRGPMPAASDLSCGATFCEVGGCTGLLEGAKLNCQCL